MNLNNTQSVQKGVYKNSPVKVQKLQDSCSDSSQSDNTKDSSSSHYISGGEAPSKSSKFIDKDGQVKENFPRDHFYTKETWTKDDKASYFSGPWLKFIYPIIKTTIILTIFLIMIFGLGISKRYGFLICMTIVGTYQHVMAKLYNLVYMPAMDQQCFCSSKQSILNYMSVTAFEGDCLDEQYFSNMYKNFLKEHEKFSYKVVEKHGEIFYEKMNPELAFERGFQYESNPDKILKNYNEIDCYIRDNINKRLPLDGPQWRCYAMKFKDDYGKLFFIQIWKCHHSFMDGVSCMALTAASTKEYSRDYFVKSKDATILQEMLIKLSIIFYLPMLIMNTLFTVRDKNCITKGKKQMTGNINVSSSKNLSMKQIKDLSKKLGITVNDILMCATSSAFKEYFRIRGDKLGNQEIEGEEPQTIQVLLPANIRFRWYPTREAVKLENKFSALPLKLPMISEMKNAYGIISKQTKKLKNTAGYVYSSYAITALSAIFGPRFIPRLFLHKASMKFTMAISNTPGPIKPFIYENEKGQQSFGRWCQSYVMVAGRVGLCVSAMSYDEAFRLSVTADEGVCQDTKFLVDKIHTNILNEIQRMKDIKVPSAPIKKDNLQDKNPSLKKNE